MAAARGRRAGHGRGAWGSARSPTTSPRSRSPSSAPGSPPPCANGSSRTSRRCRTATTRSPAAGDTVQRLVGGRRQAPGGGRHRGLPLLANVITLVVMCTRDALPRLAAGPRGGRGDPGLPAGGPGPPGGSPRPRAGPGKGEGDLANTAHETLGAMRTVQAYGLEERHGRSFGARATAGSSSRACRPAGWPPALERGHRRARRAWPPPPCSSAAACGCSQGAMTPGDLVLFLTYLKTCHEAAAGHGQVHRAHRPRRGLRGAGGGLLDGGARGHAGGPGRPGPARGCAGRSPSATWTPRTGTRSTAGAPCCATSTS